jgi:hypothetical protein
MLELAGMKKFRMIPMNAVPGTIPFLFLFIVAGTSGCSPEFNYQPIDGNAQPLTEWSESVDGVRFSAGQFSAVIGSKDTIAFIDVDNQADMRAVVLGGELLTNGRSIEAHVLDDAESVKARSVPARSGFKRVMLRWQLDSPASELLGSSITWVWKVRIGPNEHVLRIPMQRRAEP